MANPVIQAHSDELMKAGFLFLESDPDTAPEAIEKLRESADALAQRVEQIRAVANKMEAQLDRYTVEPYEQGYEGYVVIYTDANGKRWQDHLGTLTKRQAEMMADRKNGERR